MQLLVSGVLYSLAYAECGSDSANAVHFLSIDLGQDDVLSTCPVPLMPHGKYVMQDVDGDGRDDIVVIDSNKSWWWSKSGKEPFIQFGVTDVDDKDLLYGDFDGDGKIDMFTTDGNEWRIAYGNQGHSDWRQTEWTTVNLSGQTIGRLYVVDVDGDGNDDILSIFADNTWRYSSGGVTQWITIAVDSSSRKDLLFGDFNGDGKNEAFKIDNGTWYHAELYNVRSIEWKELRRDDDIRATVADFAIGDFDGDGKSDIFTGRNNRWWYSSGGTSNWTKWYKSAYTAGDLYFGDLDNDGYTDILRAYGGSLPFWINNGYGGWQKLITNECECPTRLLKPFYSYQVQSKRLAEEFKGTERGIITLQGVKESSIGASIVKELGGEWKQTYYSSSNESSGVVVLTNMETDRIYRYRLPGKDKRRSALAVNVKDGDNHIWVFTAELSKFADEVDAQVLELEQIVSTYDSDAPMYIGLSTNTGDSKVIRPLERSGFQTLGSSNACTRYSWNEGVEWCIDRADYLLAKQPNRGCHLYLKYKNLGYTYANEENSICPSKLSYRLTSSHKALYINDNIFDGNVN